MGGSRIKFERGNILIGGFKWGKALFKLDNTRRLRN
jgi:hypothetical protein